MLEKFGRLQDLHYFMVQVEEELKLIAQQEHPLHQEAELLMVVEVLAEVQ